IGPTSGQIALLCDLASVFPERKYYFLYVLLLSHADNRKGRYQSPPIESYQDLELFLWTFQTFFEQDGRHHIWVASVASDDLLVYDQHNVIFAYGNIDGFEERLRELGYEEKEFWFPVPHAHTYPAANVHQEQGVLEYYDWHWSELQEGDEWN
ncbi:MAG: hypothetical protein GY832_38215, partial [Chloroflexi bacterium]|nr:hypothetical protein [Chloroflexota bacterium]